MGDHTMNFSTVSRRATKEQDPSKNPGGGGEAREQKW